MKPLPQTFAFLGLLGVLSCHSRSKESSVKPADINSVQGVTVATTFDKISSDLLQPSCVGCHSNPDAAAGIDLSSFATVSSARTADGRALLNPGLPEQSPLVQVLVDGIMPPGGTVEPYLLSLLQCWVRQGASESESSCLTSVSASITAPPTGNEIPSPQPSPNPTPVPTPIPTPVPTPNPTPVPTPIPTPVPTLTFDVVFKAAFERQCAGCHGANNPRAGVNVTSYSALVQGNRNLVVPGDPAASLLWQVLESNSMPPRRPLDDSAKALVKEWILTGAAR